MSRRIPALDAVRGAAISMVLVWHYFSMIGESDGGLQAYLEAATRLTWSGVDLFFVLSGFLIGGILFDQRDGPAYFRHFWIRRAFRILPVYFLFLALFYLALAWSPSDAGWWLGAPQPPWSYALFVQNFYMALDGSYGARFASVSWSLAVEEQFYLVIPLLIWWIPRRALMPLLALLVVLAPASRSLVDPFSAYVLPVFRTDSLLLGVLLAALWREARFRTWIAAHPAAVRLAVAAGAVFYVYLDIARPEHGYPLVHFGLGLFFASAILWSLTESQPAARSLLEARVLRWLGDRSYSLYLFHGPVLALGFWLTDKGEPILRTWSDAAVILPSLVLSLALSDALFRWVERPMIRIGHRLSDRLIRSPAPADRPG